MCWAVLGTTRQNSNKDRGEMSVLKNRTVVVDKTTALTSDFSSSVVFSSTINAEILSILLAKVVSDMSTANQSIK